MQLCNQSGNGLYLATLSLSLFLLPSSVLSAKWSITQLPAAQRAQACQEQVSFCYNACGSVSNTQTNFCNIRTMGWNCACHSGSGERKTKHYEWPIEVAECHAALATCNDRCSTQTNGDQRVSCFTGCTTSYQCNTIEAPFSSLRVHKINERPAGYMPPLEDRDIELTIGMKFGTGAPDMSDSEKRLQRSNDPGVLPKIIPRSDNEDNLENGQKGKGKHAKGGAGQGGSGKGGSGNDKRGDSQSSAGAGRASAATSHAAAVFAAVVAVAASASAALI